VTLADHGVAFSRGATAPDASLIVRRGFSDPRPSSVRIAHDPQLDLVSSSAGALYYVFGDGWYRWDFGTSSPRRTRFAANPPAPLLAYEGGRWFLHAGRPCRVGVVAVPRAGRRVTVASASRLRALTGARRDLCVELEELQWTGRQALSAWGVVPAESEESHSDEGLFGVVLAGKRLR
jgi:hypothetical protein